MKKETNYLNTGCMTALMFPYDALPTSSRKQFSAKVLGSILRLQDSESASGAGGGMASSSDDLLAL